MGKKVSLKDTPKTGASRLTSGAAIPITTGLACSTNSTAFAAIARVGQKVDTAKRVGENRYGLRKTVIKFSIDSTDHFPLQESGVAPEHSGVQTPFTQLRPR